MIFKSRDFSYDAYAAGRFYTSIHTYIHITDQLIVTKLLIGY